MNVNNYLCVQMADTEMLPCDFRFQLGWLTGQKR